MVWACHRIPVLSVVLAIALSGCNRESAQQTQPAPAPAPAVAAAPPLPPPPPPIPASTELALNSVDSVTLSRPADSATALVIHVSGSAVSSGWTDAKLTEDMEKTDEAAVKTYKLVATSPAMPDENRTPQAMEAEIRVESLPPEVTTIRIVSATNDISAPIAQ